MPYTAFSYNLLHEKLTQTGLAFIMFSQATYYIFITVLQVGRPADFNKTDSKMENFLLAHILSFSDRVGHLVKK